MMEEHSPDQRELDLPLPPLTIRGELIFSDAHKRWRKLRQPILLVDVGQLRRERQARERVEAVASAPPPVQIPAVLPLDQVTLVDQKASLGVQKLETPLPQISPQPDSPEPVETVPGATPPLLSPAITTKSRIRLHFPSLPRFGRIQMPTWHFPNLVWPRIALPELTLDITKWVSISSHFLIGSAVALLLLFGAPIIILESRPLISQALESLSQLGTTPASPLEDLLASPSPSPTPVTIIGSEADVFSVRVPSLDITSTVVPNVDPTSSQEYTKALRQGIAHAKGSGLPDQLEFNKTIYLFAHSTDAPWNILRYNAQFYALKDAEPGQTIELTFWGKTRTYTIAEKVIVDADDVSYLQPQTDQERLILQTCYPPGTTTKRLLVIATPSAELDK
jgi:LPXTG-site transpeptidase (sortase) family protein